ncbi:MAG: hypothetical protein JWN14_3768 [Chthonomonadales bacterium]|nr:hypothetical protein [Chthonomonadales bacterium]
MPAPADKSRRVGTCCCCLLFLVVCVLVLFPIIGQQLPHEYPSSRHVGAMAFSPDSQQLAYIWRNATRLQWGSRERVVMDKLEVRWYPTLHPDQERSLPFVSVDLHAGGGAFGMLETGLSFSPDSTQFAAIVPDAVLLVDVATGRSRRLRYPHEWFTNLRWLSAREVVFATTQGEKASYWRLDLEAGAVRRLVAQGEAPRVDTALRGSERGGSEQDRPLGLSTLEWAPNGRFVGVGSNLVNTVSGATFPLPADSSSSWLDWRPDSSAFLVHGDHRTLLVDTAGRTVQDLTASLHGVAQNLTIKGWTADGQLIIASDTSTTTSYLIQPTPFSVVLKTEGSLYAAPVPGWVWIQGSQADVQWVNYAGVRIAPPPEWTKGWIVAPDRSFAADSNRSDDVPSNNHVIVFHPQLPR